MHNLGVADSHLERMRDSPMNIHLIPQALRNIHKLLDNAPSDGFDEIMFCQILEELDAIGEIRLGEIENGASYE